MLIPRRTATALLAAAVVVAGACGGGGDAGTDPGATAPASSAPPSASTSATGPTARSSELLAFSAPAIGGGEVDASIHQGRPVLLWFWSPW